MYYNIETGDFGLHEGDVRSHFAQQEIVVIWGDPFTPMPPFVATILADKPEHDAATHKAVEIAPLETKDGWLQQWEIVELTAQELEQRESERLAAEQAIKDAARITVTKRQALLALYDLRGIKDSDIDAQIDLIPDEVTRYRAKVDWAGSAAVESDSATVLMLAQALSLSESDLAMLFDYAQAQ